MPDSRLDRPQTEEFEVESDVKYESLESSPLDRIKLCCQGFCSKAKVLGRRNGQNVLSGLTAGVMMLPQGLAYASLANLPDIWGLYPGVIPAFVYSMVGPCKQASVGPEALKSQLVGLVVQGLGQDASLQDKIDEVLVLSFMFGLILFVLGFMRLGYIESLLSKAVVSGFVFAVAVEIAMEQLPTMLRVKADHTTSTFERIASVIEEVSNSPLQLPSLLFSIFSVSFLWGFAAAKSRLISRYKWLVYLPDVLVLVLLAVVIQTAAKLDVATLGILAAPSASDVDASLGMFVFKYPRITIARVTRLLPSALIIALVSYVESMLVAKIYSNKHGYRVSSNKEMLALGLCNVFGSFFGSYGAQGSLPRTVVQDATGAKSNIALLASAVFVSASIAFLLPAFQNLPRPCMGAVVFVAACSLMEVEIVLFFWKMRAWADLLLWAFVMIMTLSLGIPFGIVTALVISLMQVLKQTSFPSVRVMGQSCDRPDVFLDLKSSKASSGPRVAAPLLHVHILKLEGPVFFANIPRLAEMLHRVQKLAPNAKNMSFDLSEAKLPKVPSPSPTPSGEDDDMQGGETLQESDFFGRVLPAHSPDITTIILDLSSVSRVDATALWYLCSSVKDCQRLGQRVLVVAEEPEMLSCLTQAGMVPLCTAHPSVSEAVATLEDAVQVVSAPVSPQPPRLRKRVLGIWRGVFG